MMFTQFEEGSPLVVVENDLQNNPKGIGEL